MPRPPHPPRALGGGEATQNLVERLAARLDLKCELGDPFRAYNAGPTVGRRSQWDVAEIPAFIAKLRERSSVGRVAMEVLILTAARSGEIRGATWSEFDLDKAMWSIPATRMKGRL